MPNKILTAVTIPGEASPVNLLEKDAPALNALRLDMLEKGNDILKRAGESGVSEDDLAAAQSYLGVHDAIADFQDHVAKSNDTKARFEKGLAAMSNPSFMPAPAGGTAGSGGHPLLRLGEAFTKSEQYQDALKTGKFDYEPKSRMIPQFDVNVDPRQIMTKTLLTTASASGGGFIVPGYNLDPVPLARPTPDILDLVNLIRTSDSRIIWLQQTARATGATTVAEASATTGTSGLKPESGLAWVTKETIASTIAHWVPVTNRQLADVPTIESRINSELVFGLWLQADYQVLQGPGTGTDQTGILNTSGIQSWAYATSTNISNRADAFFRNMVAISTANEPAPTGHVINPINWEAIRLMKTSGSGEYILGDPSAVGARFLWGVPVVVTNQEPSGTGLTGAFNFCDVYLREDANVKLGMADDDFLRNLMRVLAEMRLAVAVTRPGAFVKLTSL